MKISQASSGHRQTYSDVFKQEALRQLDSGMSLRQVAALVNVSKNSLLRWKSQNKIDAQPAVSLVPIAHQDDESRSDNSLTSMKNAPHTSQSTELSMLSPHSVPGLEPQAQATRPSQTKGIHPLPQHSANETKAEALGLLSTGQSILQVATRLQIPQGLVQHWLRPRSASRQVEDSVGPMIDKRRLYDDTFKEEAMRQIQSGVSVRKLSQSLGVSQVTLHKWKKEIFNPRKSETENVDNPMPSWQGEASSGESPSIESSSEAIESLLQQVRTLEEERDVLKKALLILLRPS